MKLLRVGAELFHAEDRRTGMTNLVVLTVVQIKVIRINVRKRNNIKHSKYK